MGIGHGTGKVCPAGLAAWQTLPVAGDLGAKV
jgi:hypothetical protein